jgi:hypothetical protein
VADHSAWPARQFAASGFPVTNAVEAQTTIAPPDARHVQAKQIEWNPEA